MASEHGRVTAAVLIIGDEILSGRTQDTNLRDIARYLGVHGVDVAEVRITTRFIELHKAIWDVMREEVLKGYAQQKKAA